MIPDRHIVVLIPAYNEESSIASTIEAVLNQERKPDRIVVIPNGCSDQTAIIARAFPITVLELPRLTHKKSEALNRAWHEFAEDADIVVCLDADTILPPNAIGDWESEFLADAHRQRVMDRIAPVHAKATWDDGTVVRYRRKRRVRDRPLMGSSAKFTLLGKDFLTRLQRIEYATCIDQAVGRGYTAVLAGAGCALSGDGMRMLAARSDRDGPWCYDSVVEDYELTYRLREMGFRTAISPTVRAYTDSMKTQRALYSQRMKWSTGMLQDLMRFGVNRLNWLEWSQVLMINTSNLLRLLWAFLILSYLLLGQLHFSVVWWLVLPALFIAVQVKYALRIPHRDRMDLLYAFMIWPAEAFVWIRMRWTFASLFAVIIGRPVRRAFRRAQRDRWAMQHAAEAWGSTLWNKVTGTVGRITAGAVALSMIALVVGAAVPSLGVPNLSAALGLNVPPPAQASSPYHRPEVPAGYAPPAECLGYVALTYDDGPTDVTRDLVDSLNDFGLHATFFMLGSEVQRDPAGTKYVVDQGHGAEAHSMSHAALPNPQAEGEPGAEHYGVGHQLTNDDLIWEIRTPADLIEQATGVRPTLSRPPYGYTNAKIRALTEELGMEQALWTVDTNDWQGKTAKQIAAIVNSTKDQDIILAHDNDQADLDSLPLIAQGLADKGLCTGKLVRGDHESPTDIDDDTTERVSVLKP